MTNGTVPLSAANDNKPVIRTPAQHRALVDAWRATAPKDDSQIFARRSASDAPRHGDLIGLQALLAFRNRPAGVAEDVRADDLDPLKTNWQIIPANDNEVPDEGFDVNRGVEYDPSLDGIEAEIATLPMSYRTEPSVLDRRSGREVHGTPLGTCVEYGTHVDEQGKPHRVIVRIGKLRFSDGTKTERGYKMLMGELVETDIRLPVGAMLQSREKATRELGCEIDDTASNAHFRWIVNGATANPPKLHRSHAKRVSISKEEARKELAAAYAANPDAKVTKCPDGFPYGPTSLRQLFIGGRKGKKGESGSQAWQDISTEKENRDAFNRALDIMQDDAVRLITEAVGAKSLTELGERRGYKGRHAIDAGRRLLRAANDNFEQAMKLADYAAEAA